MTELVDLIPHEDLAPGFILITPTPYEPRGAARNDRPKNSMRSNPQAIRKLSDRLVAFAKQKAIPVVDLNGRVWRDNRQDQGQGSLSSSRRFGPSNSVGQASWPFLIPARDRSRRQDFSIWPSTRRPAKSSGARDRRSPELTTQDGLVMTRKVSAFPFETSGNPAGSDFAPCTTA